VPPFTGFRIIKEMPGSVASGILCRSCTLNTAVTWEGSTLARCWKRRGIKMPACRLTFRNSSWFSAVLGPNSKVARPHYVTPRLFLYIVFIQLFDIIFTN
jgi:hypothetical protein